MTPERLRAIYGPTSPHAEAKVLSQLDAHCRLFVKNSTFLALATSDGTSLDVSPKGDPAGFVVVSDDRTLLIPDRPGNNRIDGLLNILAHPRVAIFLMIPTVDETLRINGLAEISDDIAICEQFAVKGRIPKTVLRITVEEAFFHCGKALLRGGIWRPETWPKERVIPSLYEIIRDHSGLEVDSTKQSYVEIRYGETLY